MLVVLSLQLAEPIATLGAQNLSRYVTDMISKKRKQKPPVLNPVERRVTNKRGKPRAKWSKSNKMVSWKDDIESRNTDAGIGYVNDTSFVQRLKEEDVRIDIISLDEGSVNFSEILPMNKSSILLPQNVHTIDQLLSKLRIITIIILHRMSIVVHAQTIPPTMTVDTVQHWLPEFLNWEENRLLRWWVNDSSLYKKSLRSCTRDLDSSQLKDLLEECELHAEREIMTPSNDLKEKVEKARRLRESRMRALRKVLKARLSANRFPQMNLEKTRIYRTLQVREEVMARTLICTKSKKILEKMDSRIEMEKRLTARLLIEYIATETEKLKLANTHELHSESGASMEEEKASLIGRISETKFPLYRGPATAMPRDDISDSSHVGKTKKQTIDRGKRCFSVPPQ